MKVEEIKSRFKPIEIVLTIETVSEARRLKKALMEHAVGADDFNLIINILNSYL